MGDLLKDVKIDVNRIILQLFMSGIFAVLPFFLLLINSNQDVNNYFSKSEGNCTLALFFLSITTGLILEDLGALIEEYAWDNINKCRYPTFEEEWTAYLGLSLPNDSTLIGQDYFRTVLIRMKFELSFAIALIIMTAGLYLLERKIVFIHSHCTYILTCVVFPLVLSAYVFFESWASAKLLRDIRKKILDAAWRSGS